MTGDITEVRYWLDLFIKGLIGIVISVVGMDYRSVKNSLKELETNKYQVGMHVEILQAEMGAMTQRLDRIEGKLDKALSR
jgi:hypothetical protein